MSSHLSPPKGFTKSKFLILRTSKFPNVHYSH